MDWIESPNGRDGDYKRFGGDGLGDHVLGSLDASGHLAGRGRMHVALHVALPGIGSSPFFPFPRPHDSPSSPLT